MINTRTVGVLHYGGQMEPTRKGGPGLAWGFVGGALGFKPPRQPGKTQQTLTHTADEFPRGLEYWDGSRPRLHPPPWYMVEEGVFGTRVQISARTLSIVALDIPFKCPLC